MNVHDLALAGAIGVGATLTMDGWNLFLKRAFGVASLDYCLLGRWVRHLGEGTLRHRNIAAAPPRPGECPVGWLAHYSIGVALAVVFVGLVSARWLEEPTLLPPMLFGLVTVVLPFGVLQPALGFGIAASKTPHPSRARLKSIGTHAVFGAGLWVSALLVSRLPL